MSYTFFLGRTKNSNDEISLTRYCGPKTKGTPHCLQISVLAYKRSAECPPDIKDKSFRPEGASTIQLTYEEAKVLRDQLTRFLERNAGDGTPQASFAPTGKKGGKSYWPFGSHRGLG